MLTEKEIKTIESLGWSSSTIISDLTTETITRRAKAPFRHGFWKIWKAKKEELRGMGYSVIKPDLNFFVCHSIYKPKETKTWNDN